MRFKSEKGLTGVDLVVAITIILVAVGTISTVYVSINRTYRSINRNSVAGKIATDIMTAIDVSYFFEMKKTVDASGNDLPVVVEGGKDISPLIQVIGSGANNLKIPIGYTVKLSIDDAATPEVSAKELLKKVDFEVSYLVNGERFYVEFTKYKGRYGAVIPERPVTEFDDANIYDYTPIKYNKVNETWETTFFGDSTWYEYAEGFWPVMVKSSKGAHIIKNGKLNSEVNPEIYVWVPQISTVTGKGYCLTTTVEVVATGGLSMDKKVYPYFINEKNTLGDPTVLEEEQVHFIYDELDYTNVLSEASINVEKGWYKFDYSSGMVKATRLKDNVQLSIANSLFEYVSLAGADEYNLIEDIFIYTNRDTKIQGIKNYPKLD